MQSPQTPPFDGKAFVHTLTTSPGVYRYFDAEGELLYVGKAGNLKKRVGSYFLKPRMEPRINAMVSQIARCEITVTRTEGEALLLESQLIKSLKPRYNILLRDDKSYPYIYLSGGEDYPRLAFHRGAKNLPGRFFGPYPSAFAVRESLNLMQKLFKVRQCEDSYFRNRSRPCLQHQIGRCTAPCVKLISEADYARDLANARRLLEGKGEELAEELSAQMERASAAQQYRVFRAGHRLPDREPLLDAKERRIAIIVHAHLCAPPSKTSVMLYAPRPLSKSTAFGRSIPLTAPPGATSRARFRLRSTPSA